MSAEQQPTKEDAWFAFLCQKYVQRADDRQKEMGLQYTKAETHDLAKECDRFAAQRVTAARRKEVRALSEEMLPFEEQAADVLARCERGYEGDEPHRIDVIARALRAATDKARREGAEAMREACAQEAESFGDAEDLERFAIGQELAKAIRSPRHGHTYIPPLPDPPQNPGDAAPHQESE